MNYKRIYDALIQRAIGRTLRGYSESHHIIPKCLGGTNNKENLVLLTPEEHFVAHQLLIKIYPQNHKLLFAANMLTVTNNKQKRNNKEYGWLKKRRSEMGFSEETKAKMRKPKSKTHRENIRKNMVGFKGKTHSLETKAKMSLAQAGKPKLRTREHQDKINSANRGRKYPNLTCPHCNKMGSGPNMTRYHYSNCSKALKISSSD